MNKINLVAKRQEDLHNGHPDYHVYAGRQLVGRIYRTDLTASQHQWLWGVNGVTYDISLGTVMHGYATDLADAKARLRGAFGRWLLWARAIPETDLKHPHIAEELRNMSA